jgi:hypothetical protein
MMKGLILRVRHTARGKAGAAMIFSCVIVLIFMLLMSYVIEIFRVRIIAFDIKSAASEAMTSALAENAPLAFTSVRERYSGIYRPDPDDDSVWDSAAVRVGAYELMKDRLGADGSGDEMEKTADDGSVLYYAVVTDFAIDVEDLTPENPGETVKTNAHATVNVEIPYHFGFSHVQPARLTFDVSGSFTARFEY